MDDSKRGSAELERRSSQLDYEATSGREPTAAKVFVVASL